MTAEVYISKRAEKTVIRGGFWIYESDVVRVVGAYENGGLVKVKDTKDRVLGLGFINDRSKIRVRLLTRDKKAVIDREFFTKRVETAWGYRKLVMDQELDCLRLIFGEADFLPGLTADKFGDVIVIQSLSLGTDVYKELLAQIIVDTLDKDGIKIRGVYERSDAPVRLLEGLQLKKGFIGKPFDTGAVYITENGVKYKVDIVNGQKTGFFLDQRLNRRAVGALCRGATVLDCFTHTGSFALNACISGAKSVIAVDVSAAALESAKQNAVLNGKAEGIEFVQADVFELLPKWIKEGRSYDVVILDPPAFTKSRETVDAAIKGYKEINLRGLRLVKQGGILATCSCSHFVGEDLFKKLVHEAAVDVGCSLRLIEARNQPPDHPVVCGSGESAYLKFFMFQVLASKQQRS